MIIWVATGVLVATSTMRALRLGNMADTYFASMMAYAVFLYEAWLNRNLPQMSLNLVYIVSSLLAMSIWRQEPSRPEPDPQKSGLIVPDALIKYLKQRPNTQELVRLVEQRNEFGIRKYGQPLMSQDGRSGVEDARQELGDLLQYCYKCRLNGSEDTKELRQLVNRAQKILLEILE